MPHPLCLLPGPGVYISLPDLACVSAAEKMKAKISPTKIHVDSAGKDL